MDWQTGSLWDSWPGMGGTAAIVLACLRVAYWLWRRRSGAAPPLFGWIGRQFVLNLVVVKQTIQLSTERAKVAQLREIIREAGLNLPSEYRDGSDGSFAWPESTLMTSRRTSGKRSGSTFEQPDDRHE